MVERASSHELTNLSGPEVLGAILSIVEGDKSYTISGYQIAHIGSLEHGEKPRDIHVTATAVGRQTLRFAFGSSDEPVIDYSLQILGGTE